MTEPTDNSQKMIDQLKEELRQKGVSLGNLAVFNLGAGEQIIGEADECGDIELVGRPVRVKNPKRLIRIQQMTQKGMSVQILIGEMDMIDRGEIVLTAVLAYRIAAQSHNAQLDFMKLYREYLNQETATKAMRAGLELPKKPSLIGV